MFCLICCLFDLLFVWLLIGCSFVSFWVFRFCCVFYCLWLKLGCFGVMVWCFVWLFTWLLFVVLMRCLFVCFWFVCCLGFGLWFGSLVCFVILDLGNGGFNDLVCLFCLYVGIGACWLFGFAVCCLPFALIVCCLLTCGCAWLLCFLA